MVGSRLSLRPGDAGEPQDHLTTSAQARRNTGRLGLTRGPAQPHIPGNSGQAAFHLGINVAHFGRQTRCQLARDAKSSSKFAEAHTLRCGRGEQRHSDLVANSLELLKFLG